MSVSTERMAIAESARLAAMEFSARHNINPLSDMAALCRAAGVDVEYCDLPAGTAGFLFRGESGPWIGVNEHHTKEEQFTTMAHELAHFLFEHPGTALPRVIQGKLNGNQAHADQELEAEFFARYLLLPIREFRETVAACPEATANMARMGFDVGHLMSRARQAVCNCVEGVTHEEIVMADNDHACPGRRLVETLACVSGLCGSLVMAGFLYLAMKSGVHAQHLPVHHLAFQLSRRR